jgi:23S rRNA pseudouridine2605 synthase
MSEVRLQKFLAESGIASRRKAEELIMSGHVRVNGQIVHEMGVKVNESDLIELDNKRVSKIEKKVYIMLNKPTGFVTTSKDQFRRPTVLDLVKGVDVRLYPVGRLDYDTSGLILLTNDGEFTYKLTHPKHEEKKVYIAEVKGVMEVEKLKQLEKGLKIENFITSPAEVRVVKKGKDTSVLQITIHEGKNRQVRKMCEAVGHKIVTLKRIAMGGLELGDLPEGKWRYLSEDELNYFK